MGKTTALRQEIKKRFYPVMEQNGFEADLSSSPFFQTFWEIDGRNLFVVDIQWEKYGSRRFVINFKRCSYDEVDGSGKKLLLGDIKIIEVKEHGRLQPGKGVSTRNWFCQDRPLFLWLIGFRAPLPAEEIVDQLLSLYPYLEEFWEDGRESKFVRCMPVLEVQI